MILLAIQLITRNIVSSLNIFQNGLLSFFAFSNKESSNVQLINLDGKDEFGKMAKVINQNIAKTQDLINQDNVLIEVGFEYSQKQFLLKLVEMGYKRNDKFFDRADFRVNGDVIDIFPAYFEDEFIRVEFFGDEVESISKHEHLTNNRVKDLQEVIIYSVNPFVVSNDKLATAVKQIEEELDERLEFFQKENKLVEHQRLKQRVEFDLEMIEGTGMCKGIENYARHLTGQKPGETPYSILVFEPLGSHGFLFLFVE